MSPNLVTFTELLRRAQAGEKPPAEVSFWQACGLCGADARYVLVVEVGYDEIYKSECCGYERLFRVR